MRVPDKNTVLVLSVGDIQSSAELTLKINMLKVAVTITYLEEK